VNGIVSPFSRSFEVRPKWLGFDVVRRERSVQASKTIVRQAVARQQRPDRFLQMRECRFRKCLCEELLSCSVRISHAMCAVTVAISGCFSDKRRFAVSMSALW
jgi:hypothetical protein